MCSNFQNYLDRILTKTKNRESFFVIIISGNQAQEMCVLCIRCWGHSTKAVSVVLEEPFSASYTDFP